jgi:hypothetical protein
VIDTPVVDNNPGYLSMEQLQESIRRMEESIPTLNPGSDNATRRSIAKRLAEITSAIALDAPTAPAPLATPARIPEDDDNIADEIDDKEEGEINVTEMEAGEEK